ELLAALDAGAWQPRTRLLGPFDPLIADRERTEELFGFRYKFELYVPAAKREFGPYTLAVLHGERLLGRVVAAVDRRARRLVVERIVPEADAPPETADLARGALADLAAWLGVEVELGDR
ncbi:MAG TPA: crosslink repair DNA glycosylase YcaQ family protein, partial [Candidatus Limnocylindria bacterium]|nr:crosslink repair DNA glycosylase YcaQ family protein [Candidatus Limnocylindria bacterium]